MTTRIKTSAQHRSGHGASVRGWVQRCAATGRFIAAKTPSAPGPSIRPVTYSTAMVARIKRLADAKPVGEPMSGQDYLNWLNG